MFDKMTNYIGTKVIKAEPMTRGEYAELSGRNSILTGNDESESDAGYHVRYADGYESWSPAQAFEEAYQSFDKMSFSNAIELLKEGYAVAREGWMVKDSTSSWHLESALWTLLVQSIMQTTTRWAIRLSFSSVLQVFR